jgi:hypothetical protein
MCLEDEQWEAEEAEAEVIHLAMACVVKSFPCLHEYLYLINLAVPPTKQTGVMTQGRGKDLTAPGRGG